MANNFYTLTSEEKLLQCAADCQSLEELMDFAAYELSSSIIVADSLHYILAASADIRKLFGKHPNWANLVEQGHVPPVRKDFDPHHARFDIPASDDIDENLALHSSIPTNSGLFSTMCDIKENQCTTLKLAVTSTSEHTQKQIAYIVKLALTIKLVFHKFKSEDFVDPKSRYLLNLVYNGEFSTADPIVYNFFDSNGPLRLYCYDITNLRQFNMLFLPVISNISDKKYILSARDNHTFVMLINTKYDYSELRNTLEQLAIEANFPIIESIETPDIKYLPDLYEIVQLASETAVSFNGANGIFQVTDFSLFLLFERIIRFSHKERIIHQDAITLFNYDLEKNTSLATTVYCYLLHNNEAPETAEALFIHRNTLDKRLRKIETIINPDWHNVSYQFIMLTSLYQLLKENNLLSYYPIN